MAKDPEAVRNKSLWLDGRQQLKTIGQAKKFMKSVGICLRYWATPGLPIASIYQAVMGKDKREIALPRAIDLTNRLMGSFDAIEVSVIADRMCLVHHSLMPALYRLVTRGEPMDPSRLSPNARRAYRLMEEMGRVTAGDVRKSIGEPSRLKDDPAYLALAELQRHLLVDRGPFKRPEKGIPYLPKEGYPYHLFREAHLDLVTVAEQLEITQAADSFVLAYLRGALFCPEKKMTSMFKLFLYQDDLEMSLERLDRARKISREKKGKELLAILR